MDGGTGNARGMIPPELVRQLARRGRFTVLNTQSACLPNSHDAALLGEYFRLNGYTPTEDPAQADLAVVASCGAAGFNERFSLDTIQALGARLPPEAALLVYGCLPAIHPAAVTATTDRAVVQVATRERDRLDALIGATVPLARVRLSGEHACYQPFDLRGGPGGRPVEIARGCANRCSYCAIRFAKGPLVSRPAAEIEAEVREGLAAGQRSFLLFGDDTGCWGVDRGESVVDLLTRLIALAPDARFLLNFFEPQFLIAHLDRLVEWCAAGRVALESVPIQSGSPRVLTRMRRDYALEPLRAAVRRMYAAHPRAIGNTIVLVGFPGETEEDFALSLEFAGEFASAYFMRYSDRPGTASSRLPDKVDAATSDRRIRRALAHSPRFIEVTEPTFQGEGSLTLIRPADVPRAARPREERAAETNTAGWSGDPAAHPLGALLPRLARLLDRLGEEHRPFGSLTVTGHAVTNRELRCSLARSGGGPLTVILTTPGDDRPCYRVLPGLRVGLDLGPGQTLSPDLEQELGLFLGLVETGVRRWSGG